MSDNKTLSRKLTGNGGLTKTGPGVLTLTGLNDYTGNTTVNAGTLAVTTGSIGSASSNNITIANSTLTIGNSGAVTASGKYKQESTGTLKITLAEGHGSAYVTAATAILDGTLNISGISGAVPDTASALDPTKYLLISTTSGITDDFTTVTISGGTGVDYATVVTTKNANSYTAGLDLTWYSGADAHGNFTLDSGNTFEVNVPLIDQPGNSGWNDNSLTKKGDGTLILSTDNTYTGATTISAGTLQAGVANTIQNSSAVTVNGTFDLNNFAQTIKNLSGANTGAITLGGAALTVNQSSAGIFGGVISGTGSLTKTGSGTLTLSGTNTYTGSTTVSAGTLELTGSLGNDLAYAGSVIVESGGTFDLSGVLKTSGVTVESDAFFYITGTELTVDGTLDILSGGTFGIVDHHQPELYLGKDSQLNNNGLIILSHVDPNVTNFNTLRVQTLSSTNNSSNIRMYVDIFGQTGDLFVVDGTATGRHNLIIKNWGFNPTGTEAPLMVVKTDDISGATFTSDPLSVGAFRYLLLNGLDAGVDDAHAVNNLYLVRRGCNSICADSVGGQRVNAETGFMQLANLGQRVGEHRNLPTTERQSWARTYRSQGSEDGKRSFFGYDQDTTGVQIGRELLAQATGNGGTLRAALSFDYARTDADFDDHADTKRDTGSMKAESYALGGYLTHTTANGAYLDLVGQVAKLHNDFTIKADSSRDKVTQKGWRAGLSVEGGYPLWKIDAAWLLEGQTQLSYQYTKYQGFKGDTYKVDSYDAETLRGRLGARLVRELTTAENKPLKLYGLVNVYRDFINPEAVSINKVNVSERYGKSWGEVGVGMQGWVSKSTSVFGDVSYQHGFSSPAKGSAREGGAVNIGVRFRF
ncbi:MAG: autotransporter outer membrane beta-barrel domain-containing protein [Candidatus Accumulibacter sp.]|nr:autotransporter outer membrane beta-barrel domain-containing protein [Accumulibacter sp.]